MQTELFDLSYTTLSGQLVLYKFFQKIDVMSNLRELVFYNNDELHLDKIKGFKIAGVEDIKDDLMNYCDWDRNTPVVAIAQVVNNGAIQQIIIHLEGHPEAKRMDAKSVFGSGYVGEDHVIKIGRFDLGSLTFHGQTMSEWLGSNQFKWVVQRPSTTEPGVYCDLDKVSVQEQGGFPLHLRAAFQPWTGEKTKLVLALYSCLNINRVGDSMNSRFPMVGFYTGHPGFLPRQHKDFKICLPFVPYIIVRGDAVEGGE